MDSKNSPTNWNLTKEDFLKARKVVEPIIEKTPVEHSRSASDIFGSPVIFKLENQQKTGSFKMRGAFNKISQLSAAEKAKGVICSSAGNHAQGVALSARLANVPATVVMPESASLAKVMATKSYGAKVVQFGKIYDDAFEKAQSIMKETGATFVHPYEDPLIIAGQGTIALELLEQAPEIETVVVPIGGGGVISGVACAMKLLKPSCKIIGVQSEKASSVYNLYKGIDNSKQLAQNPQDRITTIADGIAVKKPSQIVFDNFISKYVDDIVTVTDDEIAEGIVFLLERSKTLAEGSGAAGWAAGLSRKVKAKGSTCFIITGGNIDLNILSRVIQSGQIHRGGLVDISVVVPDMPGSLNRLTQILAAEKANILEVHHDRVAPGLYLRETKIDFVLETIDREHISKIKSALINAGGRIL